ncbi:MAG: RING finger protein, partial [Candidatus Sericytochromatia bacterium]
MLKSYAPNANKTCPFCLNQISKLSDTLVCSECAKPHHKNCWQYNLNRCASFGCKGNNAFIPLPPKEEVEKIKVVPQEQIVIGTVEKV